MARRKKSKLIYETNDWTPQNLALIEEACAEIAFKELGLNCYPNQIEIISSDQMLDCYASIGMPIMYDHWSFGKRFIRDERSYREGKSGLAYEIVINSNPCISYLMEENSATMQALVIAHAAFGHNHFFKNNYLFKEWTDAEGIIDYLIFVRDYIRRCEEEYGPDTVEKVLDAAHSIMDYGIDRYKRPQKLNQKKEEERLKKLAEYAQTQVNEIWNTLPAGVSASPIPKKEEDIFPAKPQENLLYFLEKYSPVLKPWEREILRCIRKISQYFYPQRQTKVMNEGFATFTHYYIMNRLWEKDMISDGHYLEFIDSHSGVVRQLPYNHPSYYGYNPYALGFDMFKDIRRMCETPTDEDKFYFPDYAGKPWKETILDIVANYRDESFIRQFLSPTIIRQWRMFEVTNLERNDHVTISGIQDKKFFDSISASLARQYSPGYWHPDIHIVDANLKGSRKLELIYTAHNNAELDDDYPAVIAHIQKLWGYDVVISTNVIPAEDTRIFN